MCERRPLTWSRQRDVSGGSIAVVILAATTLAQPGNSSIGTWKMNITKSTFSAGTASTKSTTVVEAAARA